MIQEDHTAAGGNHHPAAEHYVNVNTRALIEWNRTSARRSPYSEADHDSVVAPRTTEHTAGSRESERSRTGHAPVPVWQGHGSDAPTHWSRRIPSQSWILGAGIAVRMALLPHALSPTPFGQPDRGTSSGLALLCASQRCNVLSRCRQQSSGESLARPFCRLFSKYPRLPFDRCASLSSMEMELRPLPSRIAHCTSSGTTQELQGQRIEYLAEHRLPFGGGATGWKTDLNLIRRSVAPLSGHFRARRLRGRVRRPASGLAGPSLEGDLLR